ncbi:MAG: prepilin-type N-terminal cleavage/methylation domain-containing protein [Clostridiales bacterium]|jgi:prepilin-type N-terminal cleavage/methylation domain-containing protein|nr:prepilin-type N-terminal cleavage/methylation domain-containing protein [Clostridiales bacterium]
MNNKGFTLAEVAAAVFIFSLAALFAANITMFSANHFIYLTRSFEQREQAWTALDFTVNQIKLCNEYRLRYYNESESSTIRQIDLYTTLYSSQDEQHYILRYDNSKDMLSFGGAQGFSPGGVNELSVGITDMTVKVNDDKSLMHITLIAEDSGKSISLSSCVGIKYKKTR